MKNTSLTKEELKQEKQKLTDNITNIDVMSYAQVDNFRIKIALSTVRDQVKHFLIKACNLRQAQIYNRQQLMAVHGDMDDFN